MKTINYHGTPFPHWWLNPKMVIFAAVVILAGAHQGHSQGTTTITFDGPPTPSNIQPTVTEYNELGVVFKPVPSSLSFQRWPAVNLFGPYNGTAYIQGGRASAIEFSFANGALLNLISVDLAENTRAVTPNPTTVIFLGYRLDGTTVTTNFTTDGIIDQQGPLADFQTFRFDSQFNNLTRVEIPNSGWSLDNLVLTSIIPEPSSQFLLGLGGLFLAGILCKRPGGRRVSSAGRPL